MLDTVHCTSLQFVNVMQKMTDCQTDMSLYKNLTVGWLSKIPQPHYIKITALKYLFYLFDTIFFVCSQLMEYSELLVNLGVKLKLDKYIIKLSLFTIIINNISDQ